MNLLNYKKAVKITKIPRPSEAACEAFKYEVINVYGEPEDLQYKASDINLKTYKPSKNDKLHFFKNCDVPRYKVRAWGKDKKISITNDQNKATHIIAGVKTVSALIIHDCSMSENASVYCDWLEKNYEKHEISELQNLIKFCNNDKVYFDRFGGGHQSHGLGTIPTYQKKQSRTSAYYGFKCLTGEMSKSEFTSWERLVYVSDDSLSKLNLIFSPTSNIYSEKSIIEFVNENSAIIDQSMYMQIKSMFESQNREDRLMGLSIISNCNVKPSLHFILLLLKDYSHIISSLKESKHVNFKSLLKYLALPRWDFLSDDDVMQCLMDKDELTMKIIKEIAESVKDGMQRSYDTTHFKINTIVVSDIVKNHMLNKMENAKLELETNKKEE